MNLPMAPTLPMALTESSPAELSQEQIARMQARCARSRRSAAR